MTIAAGQTSINVTLNGSGSSDPDGTIASYNWTGTPDPANTVSPTVTLAAGSYTFSLVVTDNQRRHQCGGHGPHHRQPAPRTRPRRPMPDRTRR